MALDHVASLTALQIKVHEVLESKNHQNLVAVLGWNGNWHNDITRTLERLHHARFYEELHNVSQLPQRAGYVLYTHHINHTIVRTLKRRHVPTSSICLRPHQIHDMLRIWWEAHRLRA